MFCVVILALLYFVKLSTTHPFILDSFLNNCYYNLSNGETSFTSKLWIVEHDNFILYYTLCGYIPQKATCGINAAACIKYKQDQSSEIIGRKFILGTDDELSLESDSIHGSPCKYDPKKQHKLKIKFGCSEQIKETHLEVRNDCEFVIYMMAPNCQPKCTTIINKQLVDLRPLRKNYSFQSKGRHFNIMLCGLNRFCDTSSNGISICEITNGTKIPLSKLQNEILVFNEGKNNIVIHGSYKGQDKRKVELLIKCNWNLNSNNITDKTPPRQRRHYKFEMESSYGCIKLPPNCVIKSAFFIYNLTNLYSRIGYLEVSNVPNGSIYLNICGPLHLNLNDPKNDCSSSFSQVCEINNGNYINKGSILSKFDVVDDIIKGTFIYGARCNDSQDPSRQYNTHVELFCSKTEEGPKFVRSEKCDTFIKWNTPLACPLYDISSCTYINREFQNCSVQFEGQHYDLTPLTLSNSNYDVKDTSNDSIMYRLNVCGPVTDSDAPCMKNSMIIMKDLDQNNVKYRIKSLGKMDIMTVVNGEVVIETSSGAYCGNEGDYKSFIYFICSDFEGKPQLVNKTECTFHFQWKTPHSCPKKEYATVRKCIIQDPTNNFSLDFAKIKYKPLEVNLNKNYVFDLCKENYTECELKGHCSYFPVQKQLFTNNDKTYLEVDLQKNCESENDINIVLFELVCDSILNNEHFTAIGVENCTLTMELSTHLICSKQDDATDVYIKKNENMKYDISDEQIMKQTENCSVTNKFTGYKFFISSLRLNVPILQCPEVSFNNQTSSVILTYADNRICKASNKNGTYEYRILLKCSKDDLENLNKSECTEIHNFENPKFCKLFENPILDSTSKTGIIIGSVFGVLGLIGISILCFLLCRKRRRLRYDSIYEKDADL